MRDDEFEWDDAKDTSNLAKHEATFETARAAFDDPNWIEDDDLDPDELRYLRICQLNDRIYAIICTDRGSRSRLISARRANAHEQHRYEEGQS